MISDHDSEEWRPVTITGYEHLYEVSSFGRVRSIVDRQGSKAGVLSPSSDEIGRLSIMLCNRMRRRRTRVHTLVLLAFHGPRPAGLEGCHNDGNNQNNRAGNLRWDTHRSNLLDCHEHGTFVPPPIHLGERNSQAKLTKERVLAIRALDSTGVQSTELAERFQVAHSTIRRVVTRMYWRHV